ncbi:MAG: HAMP domain-containing histidine kinase [Lachnospiraceae bacterium]|nr:HAMP domain-containing histidine kinase [Lachnospiraceae bacterium]
MAKAIAVIMVSDMKINTKIKLSFILYIIIPVLFITLSIVIVTFSQKKSLERSYGITIESAEQVFNSTILLDKISESAIEEVRRVISEEIYLLGNEEYLEQLSGKLASRYSYVLITKNGKQEYVGTGLNPNDFVTILPTYDEIGDGKMKNFYAYNEDQYLIKAEKFTFQDGSKGVVYIVSKTGEQLDEVGILVAEIIVIAVLIFLLTAIVLTVWLYNTVMTPLYNLKRATEKIARGELDFVVRKYEDDEFGDLSESFEIMRSKLKESVEANLIYDKESKELISNISHDLKTPITTIKGYVEGLMDGVADTEEKRLKYLKTIYNKSVDMDRLISELTLYSQIDTNTIPYNFVKLNIAAYMHDFYDETSIELEQNNMIMTFENLLHKNEKVLADSEKLRRVINNIVGNSVKYIDKTPGKVDIKISDAGNFVKISISDNGKGIEEKDIDKIFDRFYRTDASRNSKRGGSGIGLAIVKKIVEAHGGSIWAESVYEEGTTIHFTLKKAE